MRRPQTARACCQQDCQPYLPNTFAWDAGWAAPTRKPSSGLDSSDAQSLPIDTSQSSRKAAERAASEHQPIPSRSTSHKVADSGKEKQTAAAQQPSQKVAGKQPADHQPGDEKQKPTKAERRATQDRQRAEKAAAKVHCQKCTGQDNG